MATFVLIVRWVCVLCPANGIFACRTAEDAVEYLSSLSDDNVNDSLSWVDVIDEAADEATDASMSSSWASVE